jgi:hypothetical protein
MLEFHRARDAEATILVTKVDDPSKYGVIILDEYGRVQQFVEKPKVRGLFCWGFHQGIEFGSCLTPTISPKERCCLGVMSLRLAGCSAELMHAGWTAPEIPHGLQTPCSANM